MAKKTTHDAPLPPFKIGRMTVTIEGTAPMIQHRPRRGRLFDDVVIETDEEFEGRRARGPYLALRN